MSLYRVGLQQRESVVVRSGEEPGSDATRLLGIGALVVMGMLVLDKVGEARVRTRAALPTGRPGDLLRKKLKPGLYGRERWRY